MMLDTMRGLALCVFCCAAVSGLAQEPAPAAKVDKNVNDTPCYTHGVYIETGLSALVFRPPERKSFSVYNDDEPFRDSSQTGLRFDPGDLTVMPRLAIGYQFDRSRTPRLLGEDLRVEFSSTYYMTDKEKDTLLPPTRLTHGGAAAGFTDALMYDAQGTADYYTFNEIVPPAPGTLLGPRTNVHLSADCEQWDLNLGAKTSYTLIRDRLSISPYVAFTRQTLEQEFNLRLSETRPTAGTFYSAKEELSTEAYGATIGVDFKVQILKRFSFCAGATVSPLWADTKMRLRYAGHEWDPDGTYSSSSALNRHDDSFTFRAGVHAGFTYDVSKWFSIGANGGVDYWNDVPTVQYPIYAPTERIWPGTRTPTIGHDHMLNWMGGMNLIFRFGGP